MSVHAEDFVGRVEHLRHVERMLRDLQRGRGGLLVVTGESGIGKTSLCEEIATRAAADGVRVAWAACWESASVAPLWPWAQLLRLVMAEQPHLLDGLPDRRRWAETVMGGSDTAPDDDAATARVEVASAVLDVLRAAGKERSWLLVLDDAQWADAPSLRLLAGLVPALRSMPVMMAVAYRDADTAADVDDLRSQLLRHGWVISLEGLTPAEVAELVERTTGTTPDGAVVDLLYERAAGNPLFTRELVRFGLDVGDALPPTVGATLGARLARLTTDCRRLLKLAAVMGDEFTVDLVTMAGSEDRLEMLAAVDEAVSARLVQAGTGPGRFRFVHALARAAALEGVGLAERVRLHGVIADALERLRRRGHAVEAAALAHHFTEAAAAGPAAKAVAYSIEAAEEATRRTAYEEAARLVRQALGVLELDPAAADRIELLLALADAELASGVAAAARQAYLEAASHARNAGRPDLFARAALGVGGGGGFEVTLADREQIDLLEEALEMVGAEHLALRSRLCGRLSIAVTYESGQERRQALAHEAVEQARASGDADALAWALAAYCDAISGPAHLDAREGAAEEVIRLARRLRDRRLELLGRRVRAMTRLERGDVAGFDREVNKYESVARALRQPLYLWFVPFWRAMRVSMAGAFDEAEHLRQGAMSLGTQAGSVNSALLGAVQRWCAAVDQGRSDDAIAALDNVSEEGLESVSVVMARAVSHAAADRIDDARVRLDLIADDLPNVPVDSEWLPLLCQVAFVVDRLGAHPVARWTYEALLPHHEQFAVEGIGAWCRGSAEEFLGLLALALDRPADADRHLATAAAADDAAGASFAARRAASRRAACAAPAVFRRTGEVWELSWAGTDVRVRDRKGLHDLARLLAESGREIAAVDLAGASVIDAAGGATLDGAARAAYTARLRQLETELDESDDNGDIARSAQLGAERDALLEQLTSAYGLGGRARRLGPSTAERARSTVTQRIRDTLRHLDEAHPRLAAHLRASVRTGAFCVYDPADPIIWRL